MSKTRTARPSNSSKPARQGYPHRSRLHRSRLCGDHCCRNTPAAAAVPAGNTSAGPEARSTRFEEGTVLLLDDRTVLAAAGLRSSRCCSCCWGGEELEAEGIARLEELPEAGSKDRRPGGQEQGRPGEGISEVPRRRSISRLI